MDFDDTLQTVGSLGTYQKRLTVIACCCYVVMAFHALSSVFITYTPDHWCKTPDVYPNTSCTPIQVSGVGLFQIYIPIGLEMFPTVHYIYVYCSYAM